MALQPRLSKRNNTKFNLTDMEKKLKYNIGDKVIHLELDYLDNWYHFKQSISEYEVKGANQRLFSVYKDKISSDISGSDMYAYNFQETGAQLYGNKKFYHKVKDAEEITKLISSAVNKYNSDRDAEDANRIQSLKSIIESSQKEIELIESGEGNYKMGFTKENRNVYLNKVLQHIKSKFNFL